MPQPDDRWRRVAAIAGTQHGVVSAGQLLECGLSTTTIRRAVAAGHLHRLHRAVYAVGHLGLGRRTLWKAATLAVPGIVSHRASAEAQELLRPRAGRVDVTVASTARNGRERRRGLRIHRVRELRADERTEVHGIPCTSPARCVIELAGSQPERIVALAVRHGEGRKKVRARDVARLLARHPNAKGHALLVEMLRLRDPVKGKSRSDLELIFFDLCDRFGFPHPEVNVRIWANGRRHEVDFVWPDLRLAIETDGRTWHEGEYATSLDETKDRDLTIAGWRVHRLTWRQVILDPEGAAATVRSLIEAQRRLAAAGGSAVRPRAEGAGAASPGGLGG